MLHVTNGSVMVSRLHDLGVGAVLPWDDVLHEGPVPEGLAPADLGGVRAAFLAGEAGDLEEIARQFEARDRRLDEAAGDDEVVLWFEHDLYDQLQVLQVMDRLGAATPTRRRQPRVTAVMATDYLSAQTDDTLRAWFGLRRVPTPAEWEAAADDEMDRILVRLPRKHGRLLAEALVAGQVRRNTHRQTGPIRVQIDPPTIG